jgi:hypothetical protein
MRAPERHESIIHERMVVNLESGELDVTVIGPSDPGDSVALWFDVMGLGTHARLPRAVARRVGELLIAAANYGTVQS